MYAIQILNVTNRHAESRTRTLSTIYLPLFYMTLRTHLAMGIFTVSNFLKNDLFDNSDISSCCYTTKAATSS